MQDLAPDLDLERAARAMQCSGSAIACATQEMRAAGVPRDQMLGIFAGQVAIAAFEGWETVGDEAASREIADQLAAMLSSPLSGMAPRGWA